MEKQLVISVFCWKKGCVLMLSRSKKPNSTSSTFLSFAKSSGIYLIGTVLSKTIYFILLPLYTTYILPSDFGYYDLSITTVTLITGFFFIDVWTSVLRFMVDCEDIKHKKEVIFSGWILFSISSFLYSIVGIIITYKFDVKYATLVILFGLFINLSNMYGYIARGLNKNKEFVVSGIINTVVVVTVNIGLIIFLHFDYSALYIASILGFLSQLIFLEYKSHVLFDLSAKQWDRELIIKIFKYSLPLCLNTIAFWLLTSFNRVVISVVLGTEANGFFAIGSKFGMIIAFITTSFTFAWQDLSFSYTSKNGKDGLFYTNASNAYMKFLGAGAAVLIPCCYLLFPLLVKANYKAALNTIPLFLLVGIISALSTFIGNIFYAIKDTKPLLFSLLISCLLNLILCYPLILRFGLNGANISIILSFVLNIFIRNVILKRKVDFHLDIKNIIMMLLWIAISYFVYNSQIYLLNIFWFISCLVVTFFIFRLPILGLFKELHRQVKDRYSN